MANKVKNHSEKILEQIKEVSNYLYAEFIKSRQTITSLSTKTGLSTNSLKTILKGETANIASYMSVASSLGLSLVLVPTAVVAEEPKAAEVKEVSETFQGSKSS